MPANRQQRSESCTEGLVNWPDLVIDRIKETLLPSSRPFVSRFSFRVIDFPATSPGTVSSGPRIGPERRRNPPDRTRPLSGCEIGGTALLFCQVARSFPAFLFIIFVRGFSSPLQQILAIPQIPFKVE
jgi:hypothetical protein